MAKSSQYGSLLKSLYAATRFVVCDLSPYGRAARSCCYSSSPIVPTAALILQLPCVRKRLSATDEDVVDGDVDCKKRIAVSTSARIIIGRMEEKETHSA